jgi:hypothetical protein
LTAGYTELDTPAVTEGVYEPREDSQLLVDIMEKIWGRSNDFGAHAAMRGKCEMEGKRIISRRR